jgi:2-dehydropantoate 2-reductase
VAAITVIGPGAIGGLVAARLCQNRANAVTIAVRTTFDRLRLEAPSGVLESKPRIVTRADETKPADWILVATKAYDSSAAAAWFENALDSKTQVAILQNGVDHIERFSQWLPRDRILPVVVNCPSERLDPGHIRQRGPARLSVPSGSLGAGFESLFAETGIECRLVDDFLSVAWWKLCLNAAGVVNALTLRPSSIVHEVAAADLMRRIIDEAAAVGRAEGATLPTHIADEIIDIYRSHPADSVNSLLADRLAGRPMEVHLRNGIVVELGRKHGIETPCNEMAATLLTISTETAYSITNDSKSA